MMWKMHSAKSSEMTVGGFFSQTSGRYSAFNTSKDMRIIKKINSDRGFVSGGVYLLGKHLVSFLKSLDVARLSFEEDLTPQLLSENWPIFGFHSEAFFIDIGIPEDYAKAEVASKYWLKSD